jgi:hypothetical protein
MVIVRLYLQHAGRMSVMTFRRTPIRIGRDGRNECRIELGFISRRHARIDLHDAKLLLCDEGSRMGTWIHQGRHRLEPRSPVDLAEVGLEFHVGAIPVRVERHDGPEPQVETQLADVRSAGPLFAATVTACSPLAAPVAAGEESSAPARCGVPESDSWRTALDPREILRAVRPCRWSPLRHRALWYEFTQRYQELAHRSSTVPRSLNECTTNVPVFDLAVQSRRRP